MEISFTHTECCCMLVCNLIPPTSTLGSIKQNGNKHWMIIYTTCGAFKITSSVYTSRYYLHKSITSFLCSLSSLAQPCPLTTTSFPPDKAAHRTTRVICFISFAHAYTQGAVYTYYVYACVYARTNGDFYDFTFQNGNLSYRLFFLLYVFPTSSFLIQWKFHNFFYQVA